MAIRHPEIYEARAAKMLELKVMGKTDIVIAEKFDCSVETVGRSLAFAVREGLTRKYENTILDELVPLAIGVYRKKLQSGDTDIAKDVIDKLSKLGERFEKREQAREELSLSAYLQSKRYNRAQPKKNSAETLETIDGQVIHSEPISVATLTAAPPKDT